MASVRPVTVRRGAAVATFAAVTAGLVALVRPFDGGPAAADAASSVLFWDRIVAGQRLEVFLNTTPKPLLTVAYGILHAIDPSWHLVSLAAVVATAVGIVLAGEVARRVAGIPAAVFTVVALSGNAALLGETSWAYGLGWALAFWMAAALALLRPAPRYGSAGALLALASLARPETFLILGLALGMLALAALGGRPPPRAAWRIGIGLAGLIGFVVHDVLLTGDPLWWTKVAGHAVELNSGRSRSVVATIRLGTSLLIREIALSAGATIGGLILVRRREWIAAAGLVALGPLVVIETWVLAVRHVNVLTHYLHPVELALILGTAVTIGTVATLTHRWVVDRAASERVRLVVAGAALVLAFGLGVVLVRPHAWLSPSGRASVALQGQLDGRAAGAIAAIRSALPARPPAAPSGPGALGAADPAGVFVFVPRHRLPRSAVDLGLPLTGIAVLDAAHVDLAAGYPRIGSIVYLDTRIDPAGAVPAAAPLRVTTPTTVGPVRIVPIQVDPAAGIWIVEVVPAT